MSIHSLPPELFLLLFGLTQPRPIIDINFYSHRDFVDNLLSFSLVHSTWTGSAHTLLMENIWIDGLGKSFEEISQGVGTDPFKTTPVKTLTFSGGGLSGAAILKRLTMAQWSHIVCLRLMSVEDIALEDLALLPNLRYLDSERGNYTSSQRHDTLPQLSRLTLKNTSISLEVEEAQRTFSPSTLPQLTSLAFNIGATDALLRFDTFFQNLLPQITSLALTRHPVYLPSSPSYRSIISSLPHLANLAHLSIDLPWKVLLEFLVDLPGSLNLEILHVALDYSYSKILRNDYPAWKQMMETVVAIAGGEEPRPVKAKKVYVYGKKKTAVRLCPEMTSQLDTLSWVKGPPPFASFDGKFMGTVQR